MILRFGVIRGDLQQIIFNHIITPLVFTGNSIPVHKFYNPCDGRARYMDAALLFPRSLRLSSSISICIFLIIRYQIGSNEMTAEFALHHLKIKE